MATIKSFTDIEQSKKLAEILPLESADMYFIGHQSTINPKEWEYEDMPKVRGKYVAFDNKRIFYPCWSFAALLDVLPKKYYPIKDHKTDLILGKPKDKWCVLYWDATGMQDGEQTLEDNPVDACVAMIEKLHELKML